MIRPIIHRQLTRGDLACLVDEIARMDVTEGREADEALQAGAVDTVLDSPAALEAVLGRGGAPAPLPLTLLWYIPIRAQLRTRGISDILLADYAATLPVVFATVHRHSTIAQGEDGMAGGWCCVAASRALGWAGCVPEWVERGASGGGMVRAYVTFAGRMLALAADLLEAKAP